MQNEKEKFQATLKVLVEGIAREVLGKERQINILLCALLARGHLLIEDIPGVGKTTLAKRSAKVLGLQFGRIQFTSDMLPSDILGVNYFDTQKAVFRFKQGPVFTQLLLADEINRAMPKTQSALLEAMEEHQVTIEGKALRLPFPFFVIGTQNPHEEVGTFPLPHSQLDRFMLSMSLGYIDRAAERELLATGKRLAEDAAPALDRELLVRLQQAADSVHLSDAMLGYLQNVIAYTRESGKFRYGLSTRAALDLAAAIRAWAFLQARDFAIPDDLQAVVGHVAGHRLQFVQGASSPQAIRHDLLSNVDSDL